MTVTAEPTTDQPETRRRLSFWGGVFALVCVGFVVFWVWALFFASKESVNKIGDRAWADRAEGICAAAVVQEQGLINFDEIDHSGPGEAAGLIERAGIVDQATDMVEQMLNDVVAVTPKDAKGQALVPMWEADYHTYIENRREFTAVLRAGDNDPFREAAVDGIPITDKLTRFAGDNYMPSCAPPQDLTY